ncbi:MAG: hypothetical protein HZA08_07950 [Nitrospirae bacterium]|nr:hypothetical protein [Nitrospirota bacterium]
MRTAQTIKKELEKVFNARQSSVLSNIIVTAYSDLVKTNDFNELKGIVKDLAEAQKRTELRVEELAEAQKRTELRVEELAEAQKRTELKVEELAEAQKRTELKVEELAEAQKRTENSLNRLIGKVEIIEERLEGVSNSVGYSLEDLACKSLPDILEQEEGIEVTGRLIRRYYETSKGKYNQINIYGKARAGKREILLLGEAKVRPSRTEIDRFVKIAERIKEIEGNPEVYLLFVAYDYHPNTEKYLKEKGIRYFWSYELQPT